MKRAEFEHAVRVAAAVLGVEELLVIGSQALHGSVAGDIPEEALRSVEVDVAALEDADGRKADLIDGAIGEASMFHATFGYYAKGVKAITAVLPEGWRDRLVRFESPATRGAVAWCLEPHDLWIAKMVGGRPKDLEFCEALMERGIVDAEDLTGRLERLDVDEPVRGRIAGKIRAWSASAPQ
jgi:hypothetical protein